MIDRSFRTPTDLYTTIIAYIFVSCNKTFYTRITFKVPVSIDDTHFGRVTVDQIEIPSKIIHKTNKRNTTMIVYGGLLSTNFL